MQLFDNILIDQEAERQGGEWGWVHPQAPNPLKGSTTSPNSATCWGPCVQMGEFVEAVLRLTQSSVFLGSFTTVLSNLPTRLWPWKSSSTFLSAFHFLPLARALPATQSFLTLDLWRYYFLEGGRISKYDIIYMILY